MRGGVDGNTPLPAPQVSLRCRVAPEAHPAALRLHAPKNSLRRDGREMPTAPVVAPEGERAGDAGCITPGSCGVAFFAVPHHLRGTSRAGTSRRALGPDDPPLTLAVADGWLAAIATESGFAIEVRRRPASAQGSLSIAARDLPGAASELAAAWPHAHALRKMQWRGARITDCGRFVQVLADDTGARVEFAGIALRARDEVRAVANFVLAWAAWVERPAPIAATTTRGRRLTA